MSKPIDEKEARLTFGKGSSALARMDEFMEEHADEIEELERRFGNASKVEPGKVEPGDCRHQERDGTMNTATTAALKKAA